MPLGLRHGTQNCHPLSSLQPSERTRTTQFQGFCFTGTLVTAVGTEPTPSQGYSFLGVGTFTKETAENVGKDSHVGKDPSFSQGPMKQEASVYC